MQLLKWVAASVSSFSRQSGKALATKDVFAAHGGGFTRPGLTASLKDAGALANLLRPLGNDLTEAALRLAPEIGEVLKEIEEASDWCLLARMSGSGATCFGLYNDEAGATAAAGAIRRAHPEWRVDVARLIAGRGDLDHP